MGALGGDGVGALAGMMPREPDMGKISQIAELLGNPYADDGQKMVLQALLQREMKNDGADPLALARLGLDQQRLQLDRDKFVQGSREGPKYYGNVQWADRTPDDGVDNPEPYQIGSDGQVSWVNLDGAKPLPPVKNVNTGTDYVVQGPGGAQVAPPIAIDNAGKAAATIAGETQGNAVAKLPAQQEALQRIEGAAAEIIGDPNLAGVLGPVQGRLPRMTQASADTQARIDRFLGQTFPMAMQSLRGLGPASEREGIAAQAAIANLDQKQSPEAFTAAVNEAIAHIRRGFEIAEQQAQGNMAPPAPAAPAAAIPQAAIDAGIDPDLWPYLSPEEQRLWAN